jgi:methylmalonyl-CoA/ethylmalonyl-CoA epimerase
MKILGLDHVSIATADLEKHSAILENLFNLNGGKTEENIASKIRLLMYNLGNTGLELIESLDENSAISKFIKQRGPGIHHICLLVDDVAGAVEELKNRGIKLIDNHPRQGAKGSLIAFIHPESAGGILIELKEII